jgi:HAD superfamily phosphoserine phosphatase-like hydrolase
MKTDAFSGELPHTLTAADFPALVLFDFDGTITSGDSLIRFILKTTGLWSLIAALPEVVWKCMGLVFSGKRKGGAIKEVVLGALYRGRSRDFLEASGTRYCREDLPTSLRGHVVEQLRRYRDQGATVAVVSASIDVWLRPFAISEGVKLICTELEFKDEVFTGKFATANCKYEEKVRRIRGIYPVETYACILAFGNSAGDYAMFGLAQEAWLCRSGGRFQRFQR